MGDIDVIVELGTEEQKKLIRYELDILVNIIERNSQYTNINKIIVPANFEEAINILEGTTNYRAYRGQIAAAKSVYLPEGSALVFSALLFQEKEDTLSRMFVYLHEYLHIVNHFRLCCPLASLGAYNIYYDNLKILFDEYFCNRLAFDIVDSTFNKKTKRYLKGLFVKIKSHYVALANDAVRLDALRELIRRFRLHGNVNVFLEDSRDIRDEIMKDIVYFFSYCDAMSKYLSLPTRLDGSVFVGKEAEKLIAIIRDIYHSGGLDFYPGVEAMEEFMMLTGIRFEDKLQGLYCHVLDI